MKNKLSRYIIGSLVGGTFLLVGASVQAIPFTVTNVDGDWINPVPNDGRATINNSGLSGGLSTARWGGRVPESGYDFLTRPTNFVVQSDGNPFRVGDFTHLNFTIPNNSAIDEIELDFDLVSPDFNIAAIFTFDHEETPNGGGPPGSDDIVTIINPNVNKSFSKGGQDFFFNLLGFSQDGGSTISNVFNTAEGQSNLAGLYAKITEVPAEVPEPATMLLIGTGLAGLAGTRLRRKK